MLLNWANVPDIDPGTLNAFMESPNTLFDAYHNVNIVPTVNALRVKKPGGNLQYFPVNGPDATTVPLENLEMSERTGIILLS